MRTFTFASFKGGTAKTSTTLHLGVALAKFHKKRVLLIDFDSQANLSIALGIGPDNLKTMVPVLQNQCNAVDVIQETYVPGLNIIPSNAFLDGVEKTPQVGNDPYGHERLRRALRPLQEDFDFCLVDTPPSLGWLTQSAFFASQHSVICSIPEAFSVIALRRLKEFHSSIQQYHDIKTFGIVLSFWNESGAVNDAFLNEINDSFPGLIFDSKVRRDMVVSRSVLEGKSVFEFSGNSRAAEDYKTLTEEFMRRLQNCETIKETEVAHVF